MTVVAHPSAWRPPIDLAVEADFVVGELRAYPARREVEVGGDRQTLQPRVMQVLVALAHPTSEVVSHSELISRCWAGLSVGEDAIARCIGQLRRLAERYPAPPYEIATIAGVGYRMTPLAVAASEAAPPPPAPPATAPPRRRVWVLAGGAALTALALVGGGAWLVTRAPALPGGRPASGDALRVQMTALTVVGDGAPAAQNLAAGVSADIAGVLSENNAQTVVIPPSATAAGRPDFRLGGTLQAVPGGRLRLRMVVEEPASKVALWSREFEGPADDLNRLEAAAATISGEAIYTLLELRRQKNLKLDMDTTALMIRAEESIKSAAPRGREAEFRMAEAQRMLEGVTDRAPAFADGHALLALSLVNQSIIASEPRRGALIGRARAEAATAIRLDPAAAEAGYDTLHKIVRLTRPGDFAAAEDHLLDGLRHADYPMLNMRECGLLAETGRAQAAIPYCQRALALSPFAQPIPRYYVKALYLTGAQAEAEQAAQATFRRMPEAVRDSRFELMAVGGAPRSAQALLDDPALAPTELSAARPAIAAYLAARESGRPADLDAAARDLRAAALENRLPLRLAVLFLAKLGRTDAVFELLTPARIETALERLDVTFLMDPALAAARKDPRFWRVAADAGLIRYWRTRQTWPDFCATESTVPACQAAAAAALKPG